MRRRSPCPLSRRLAEPVELAGDELRNAVSGKTVYLNVSGFELPIRYNSNGGMSGKMGCGYSKFFARRWRFRQRQVVG